MYTSEEIKYYGDELWMSVDEFEKYLEKDLIKEKAKMEAEQIHIRKMALYDKLKTSFHIEALESALV